MNDLYLYIHIGALCVAACGILMADYLASAWMRGRVATVNPQRLLFFHWVVTIALMAVVGSGLLIFWPSRHFLLHELTFQLKMLAVVALILNSFFIDALMHKATTHAFASLTVREKLPLFVSGGISTACWLTAGLLAFFLF